MNNNLVVTYTNRNKDLIEEFKMLSTAIFGNINIHEYEDKRDGTIQITLPTIVGLFLVRIFKGIQDKEISKEISKNRYLIRFFLGAIFDDEGWVEINKRTISISLIFEKNIRIIKDMLSKLGITSSIYYKEKNNRSNMWQVSIYRRKNFIKFFKEINLTHKRKKEDIDILINSYSKKYANYELKEALLNVLNQRKISNSSELSRELEAPLSSICRLLKHLESNNFIINDGKKIIRRNGRNINITSWKIKYEKT